MDESEIQKIGARASEVAAIHEQELAAVAESREAEAKLVDAIIDAALPALGAISSKVQTGYRAWWVDNALQRDEEIFGQLRGIYLYSEQGPSRDEPRANTGKYVGEDLVLLCDGTLVRVTYDGNWSRWQGASQGWTSKITELTPREFVDIQDAELLARSLLTELEAFCAADEKRAAPEKLRARARRFFALAELLGAKS